MSFIKRDVKDRVVQYPRRYQLVEVQPGIFDLIPVTGTVTEEGTPINKAYLQPIEDGLENALEKTGDGKDVTVTFSEADTEAHIASGEKLSTMFGKILKKFKNVAPISHASSASTYGVGTTANFGHCKTINNLTQASHVNGNALSAYQGKVLNDSKQTKFTLKQTLTINSSNVNTDIPVSLSNFSVDDDLLLIKIRGTFSLSTTSSTAGYIGFKVNDKVNDLNILPNLMPYNKDEPISDLNMDYGGFFSFIKNWKASSGYGSRLAKLTTGIGNTEATMTDGNLYVRALISGSTFTFSGTVYIDIYAKKSDA